MPVVLLQILYELQAKWNVDLLQVSGLCELFPAVFLSTQYLSPLLVLGGLCELFPAVFLSTQYLSPLLVLGFTVERYISICHPFQRHRFCTTRRALTTIALLTTLTMHRPALTTC